MSHAGTDPPRAGSAGSQFVTTRWSVVAAAARLASPASQEALGTLCEAYWYPLYAYARRRGLSPDDAADRAQGFFAALLEKRFLAAADRQRGRFRSFLLTAFKRFMAKERSRANAQKRGGGRHVVSLDRAAAEGRYLLEPSHDWTPDRLYERRWALTLLDRVMARLRQQQAEAGKARLFDALKVLLAGRAGAPSCAAIAEQLGMTEGAVKVAVHRLRGKYRELLRDEVAQTLADPADADDELFCLFSALAGS